MTSNSSSPNGPAARSAAGSWRSTPWSGVFPATLCPFHDDESIDEEGLAGYIEEVASVPGVEGVVCNGHTGEIMSLRPTERARVTEIVAAAVRRANARTGRSVKAISGVSAEGSHEAIDHAVAAREAGADAILLMPPHHWLRFGRSAQTAVGFIDDVATHGGISIIIHQYPAWTKAGYTLAEMKEMVRMPEVVMVKMGTRDMARWRYDYEQRVPARLAARGCRWSADRIRRIRPRADGGTGSRRPRRRSRSGP